MLPFTAIERIVSQIKYRPDWKFKVGYASSDVTAPLFLQITFFADGEVQKCRKWLLSHHMVPSEIVRTAWKAVLAAEEHEAAERFQYKGHMIYNPHFDLDALAEFAATGNLAARDDTEKIILIGDKRIKITINGNTVTSELVTP